MNQHIQKILDIINQNGKLNEDEKNSLLKSLKDADKELEITAFKLERTEKVKKTTAILLEETIEELEHKRKAVEAQNRELEIETALEKVRSAALAMKQPADMLEVCRIISEQLELLKVREIRNVQTAIFNEKKGIYLNYEYFRLHKKTFITEIEYNLHPDISAFVNQMLKDENAFFTKSFIGSELKDWIEYQKTSNQFADQKLNEVESLHYYFYSIGSGALGLSTYNIQLNESELNILKRFRNVFELAYRRFIDIELAISQAREAQIEAALERVRSRTMGMQKSEELKEVIQLVYEQFVQLNIFIEHTGFIMDYKAREDMHIWLADKHEVPFQVTIPYFDCAHWNSFIEAKEKGAEFFATNLNFEEKNKFYNELLSYVPGLPETSKDFYLSCPGLAASTVLLENVSLYIENFSGIPYTDEANATLMRFAKVFQQTYTRFLDLQKAEAQAREAQIEASLERVRSKTMAMHKSEELSDTSFVLFKQLKELGEVAEQISIVIYNEKEKVIELYATIYGNQWEETGRLPFEESVVHKKIFNEWKQGKKSIVVDLSGEELIDFNKFKMKYSKQYKSENDLPSNRWIMHYAFFSKGALAFSTHEPRPPETIKLLERFAGVFDLTYTRFLDLKNAEEQAKEAQIEASLERVRSSAMAMHNSNDISSTTTAVFEELKKLNIQSKRCGIALLTGNSFMGHVYAATTSSDGKFLTLRRSIDMTQHQSLQQQYESWKKQKNYFIEMNGGELKSYYQLPFFYSSPDYVPPAKYERTEYGYYIPFPEGLFYAWTENPYTENEIDILKRFNRIVDLTFRRFFDLQKAEAQTREAIKQASLDRIRGEIASMRTSEDLNRITPIIWRELKILEVPFIRCGVFIVDEAKEKVQVYLTTPDGKSLGVLNLSFNANELTETTVEHWRKKKVYHEHWEKDQFIKWTQSMIEQGQIQNAETYQGSAAPPESLDLHFVPFTQGMLYVGDISPLTDEKLDLVKTLAEAFSIAYARYEDFKNLEEAKNKIEITLRELKSAQAQLIHSEKMASLGELTAGIAHEIKNPLNFVNNFSDLSKELLDEIKTELQNNNNEEVLAILEDLKLNLEKINQHGKRADSIVKGMLLHSRGTSGEKTLTDINDLLDQYVNLAYHGLRAQDKEFNITIEKDYDQSLEKINVIPQDLSRVFLNIINNACYAAYDKKKKSDDDFSPLLKVSTKGFNGKVEIKIGDNGNGIPADILDKIFQPFFTTKPTGEGTGLGLSLSYDIVKAHGGELKVETKEGEGSEFIIQIPFSS